MDEAAARSLRRFNVNVLGERGPTLLFLHGTGCNQTMWRHVAPAFARSARVVLMDFMGCGLSEHAAWSAERYATLEAHAQDVLEVVRALGCDERTVVVGHSVGASVAMLAERAAPAAFAAKVLAAPSPCFLNDGNYRGGFEPEDVEELLRFMSDDRPAWARAFAALVVGGHHDGLAADFVASFCAGPAEPVHQLIDVALRADLRALLPRLSKPALVLQASDDPLVPHAVGRYLQANLPQCVLREVETVGHAPHVTAPARCIAEISAFLADRGLVAPLRPPRRACRARARMR